MGDERTAQWHLRKHTVEPALSDHPKFQKENGRKWQVAFQSMCHCV